MTDYVLVFGPKSLDEDKLADCLSHAQEVQRLIKLEPRIVRNYIGMVQALCELNKAIADWLHCSDFEEFYEVDLPDVFEHLRLGWNIQNRGGVYDLQALDSHYEMAQVIEEEIDEEGPISNPLACAVKWLEKLGLLEDLGMAIFRPTYLIEQKVGGAAYDTETLNKELKTVKLRAVRALRFHITKEGSDYTVFCYIENGPVVKAYCEPTQCSSKDEALSWINEHAKVFYNELMDKGYEVSEMSITQPDGEHTDLKRGVE